MGVGGSSRGGTSNKKLLNMETVSLKLATMKLLRGGVGRPNPECNLSNFFGRETLPYRSRVRMNHAINPTLTLLVDL